MAAVMEENSLGMREVIAVVFFLFSLFFLLTLLTFNQEDGGWSQSGVSAVSQNAGGIMGAWLADLVFSVFGFESYLFPVLLAWYSYLFYQQKNHTRRRLTVFFHWLGLVITLIAGTIIFYLHVPRFVIDLPNGSGGILGQEVGDALLVLLSETQATTLNAGIFILGLSFLLGFSWLAVIDTVGKYTLLSVHLIGRLFFVGQPASAHISTVPDMAKKKPQLN
jgi:S-DNA-T family DNA segregation ATPase FtsK/SpoIIIE